MKWQDVSVQQFQQLTDLKQDALSRDPAFLVFDMVGVFFNLSPSQVDSLSVDELNNLSSELGFLQDMPEWKPVRFITVNGRRYRFVYDVRDIHAARNIEAKHYTAGGFIENLHKAAASMVVPQKRNRLGRWRDVKYDASKHEQYANDLRQAPITAIYGSALFFCKVFKALIPNIADYLVSTLPMEMRGEAKRLLVASSAISDGSITPQLLQSLSGLASMQPTTYPTSNS